MIEGGLPLKDIRLVIWDLDETFWRGTLTEGGINYNEKHHDTVLELCRRGIMSSICSRNKHDVVKDILVRSGIWDYFIFPSINWSSKPERILEIIEAVQLRPETVLFIDDNPMNRAQSQAAVPGLNVIDETAISSLLNNPGLIGKADSELSRLKQYKLLEIRHEEMAASGGDSIEFLRRSNITVKIIYDVESHIERAVELINRTNQLNFTKRRLPEDKAEAVKQLLAEIGPWNVRAGLVSVWDRYGDYGICGFFLVRGIKAAGELRLEHFVFSCRTLGMGIEQWVYELLGRPHLEIVGEVLSDFSRKADWISAASDLSPSKIHGEQLFGDVVIRGGCELEVLEHFFRAHGRSVTSEVFTAHNGHNIPRQSSFMLSQAVKGLTKEHSGLIAKLGMEDWFYDTSLFESRADGSLIVYSPTGDAMLPIQRHKQTGFCTAIWINGAILPSNPDRTEVDRARYDKITTCLDQEFETLPYEDVEKFAPVYKTILDNVPKNCLFLVVLPNARLNGNGVEHPHVVQAALNEVFFSAGRDCPNVDFIEISSLINTIDEVTELHTHFDRAVYRRLFEEICRRYARWDEARSAPPAATPSIRRSRWVSWLTAPFATIVDNPTSGTAALGRVSP
jgi:FkbH-like protein